MKHILNSSNLVDGVDIISRDEIGGENNLDEAKPEFRGKNDNDEIDTGMEEKNVAEEIETGMEENNDAEGIGFYALLPECAWCDHCNMPRTLIEKRTRVDDPFPVCYNKDCIYESQICDGAQNATGWQPGNRDCIDGSDEEEWFCHGLHIEYASGILNDDGSGSEDFFELEDGYGEEDEVLELKKIE